MNFDVSIQKEDKSKFWALLIGVHLKIMSDSEVVLNKEQCLNINITIIIQLFIYLFILVLSGFDTSVSNF